MKVFFHVLSNTLFIGCYGSLVCWLDPHVWCKSASFDFEAEEVLDLRQVSVLLPSGRRLHSELERSTHFY